MWQELNDWEKRNNAVCFLVITTEEVRESLQYSDQFDTDNTEGDSYICNVNDLPETLILEAIQNAYDHGNFEYDMSYEVIQDMCHEYIVEKLNITEYKQMELDLQGEQHAS